MSARCSAGATSSLTIFTLRPAASSSWSRSGGVLATAIIVFREVLEAALIVGIVMAATQGVPNRSLWVGGGIAGGALGAVVVAGFAETLAAAMAGIGQEGFNAANLFAAGAEFGLHNVWKRRPASEMARVGHPHPA